MGLPRGGAESRAERSRQEIARRRAKLEQQHGFMQVGCSVAVIQYGPDGTFGHDIHGYSDSFLATSRVTTTTFLAVDIVWTRQKDAQPEHIVPRMVVHVIAELHSVLCKRTKSVGPAHSRYAACACAQEQLINQRAARNLILRNRDAPVEDVRKQAGDGTVGHPTPLQLPFVIIQVNARVAAPFRLISMC